MSKRTQEKETKKKKKHIGLKILIMLLLILVILGIVFAIKVYKLNGNWLAVLMGHNENTLKNLDKINILMLGESQGMSDTIIVASYDPKTQKASLLSIPRDTYIGNDKKNTTTSDKINSLYNNGKDAKKTLDAVNKITGLDIKYYIVVDTEALIKLVDTIGGLEFNVPIDMNYTDASQDLYINLKKGWQKLTGAQVEQLVRFRHNNNGSSYSHSYGNEDFGRMRTQREVITEIAKQTIQFKNITEIGNIVDVLSKYINTNVDINLIKDYIPYIKDFNTENMRAEQLPGKATYLGILSFFLLDEEETKTLIDEMFNGVIQEETINENNNIEK